MKKETQNRPSLPDVDTQKLEELGPKVMRTPSVKHQLSSCQTLNQEILDKKYLGMMVTSFAARPKSKRVGGVLMIILVLWAKNAMFNGPSCVQSHFFKCHRHLLTFPKHAAEVGNIQLGL